MTSTIINSAINKTNIKGEITMTDSANSVGLDESWKQKVQNGAINIETIQNEDLKKSIDEYTKWWILCHIIYLIAGNSPQSYLATT